MKLKYIFMIMICSQIQAQVGIGTTNPDSSSALDIVSDNSGILIPRMTQSERDAITNPATGLLIFQTNNSSGFYYYDGSNWVSFGGTDTDWVVNGNDMYNGNTGNIGVGNISPSTKFHLTGTTVPGSSGGTTDLLNLDFNGYTVVQNHVSDPDCNTNGWEVTTTGNANTNCSSCVGSYLYIDSDAVNCAQNATVVLAFTSNPTTTSITIDFDYRYNNFSASGDSFRAYLYNETLGSQQGADLLNLTSDADTSFSATRPVTIGNNYSLRFEYIGDFDYGATVDNVQVTESSTPTAGSYVFRLEDGQQQNGYVLTSDANGNGTWQPSGGGSAGTDDQTLSISGNQLSIEDGNTITLPSGGGGSYTFENGLNESGGNVRLGGTLIQDTDIELDDNDLTFSTNASAILPGDVIFEGDTRDVMETNLEDDYVNFGGGFPLVDGDDGTTFLDSGSTTFTKDFVVGFDAGGTGGSAIAMGSIEYFVDGTDELFFEGSGFSPMDDETSQFGNTLGKSNRRWGAVYATNGVITTSDETYKKDIKELSYGLEEILKINAITFKWKNQSLGNTTIPVNQQVTKIGFSAQQLLSIIPEVVLTHSWVPADENGNFKRIKNEKLGVNYSDIIPVVVNAIQEQQQEIEELKRIVELLQEQNKNLKKLLKE